MSATTVAPPSLDPFLIKSYFDNKVQDAIDYGAENGPCTILLPPGYYTKDQNLTLHGQVTLGGPNEGPFDNEGLDPTSGKIGATFAIEDTGAPFITQVGNGGGLRDLSFFYPGQVGWSSSQPVNYPPTIKITGPGAMLQRLFGVNPFVFIDIECGRTTALDCHSGAIQCGVLIDHAEDYVTVSRFLQSTSYNQWPNGAPQVSALDDYTMANRYGFMINRADGLQLSHIQLWWNYCGLSFVPSGDLTLPWSRCAYGLGDTIDIDTCVWGVTVEGSQSSGFIASGLSIGAGANGAAAVALMPSAATGLAGDGPPKFTWLGGSQRGTWKGGVTQGSAPALQVKNVRGIDLPA